MIPKIEGGNPVSWMPIRKADSIGESFKAGKKEMMLSFINKAPVWNESIPGFVLDFHGRVDRPSVKNFQLVDSEMQSNVVVQFGRTDSSSFNMDVRYPFSIIQAFALCLSSLDFKFAVE